MTKEQSDIYVKSLTKRYTNRRYHKRNVIIRIMSIRCTPREIVIKISTERFGLYDKPGDAWDHNSTLMRIKREIKLYYGLSHIVRFSQSAIDCRLYQEGKLVFIKPEP